MTSSMTGLVIPKDPLMPMEQLENLVAGEKCYHLAHIGEKKIKQGSNGNQKKLFSKPSLLQLEAAFNVTMHITCNEEMGSLYFTSLPQIVFTPPHGPVQMKEAKRVHAGLKNFIAVPM
uniref:Uncharacterized protein n=1 Tax=Pyxicephalus adspersus TaxID=30357 RepID=A0AAV2ZY26_PYXAD|nr:TPA: hypothetical protein GDO54_002409 [Pyxicephalus adspersus]